MKSEPSASRYNRKVPLPSQKLTKHSNTTSMAYFRLGDLLPELHLQIVSFLSYPDVIRLCAVNSYFHNLLPKKTLIRLRAQHLLYLLDQDFLRSTQVGSKSTWTCSSCLRAKENKDYEDSQIAGTKNWGGSEAHTRLCVPCAVKNKFWEKGDAFLIAGVDNVLCARCEKVQSSAGKTGWSGLCAPCKETADRTLIFLKMVIIILELLFSLVIFGIALHLVAKSISRYAIACAGWTMLGLILGFLSPIRTAKSKESTPTEAKIGLASITLLLWFCCMSVLASVVGEYQYASAVQRGCVIAMTVSSAAEL